MASHPTGSWHKLTEQGELSYLQSNCLFEDGEGAIWIGTEAAGLYQVRPRLVQALSPPPEASRDLFWTVCASSDGSIWGGTEHSGVWRWGADVAKSYGPETGLRGQVSVLLDELIGNRSFDGRPLLAAPRVKAFFLAFANAGNNKEGRMATIAMTANNPIKVKPLRRFTSWRALFRSFSMVTLFSF